MDQMCRFLRGFLQELWRSERSLDWQRPALTTGLLRLKHDFEDVKRVFGRDQRCRTVANAFNEMAWRHNSQQIQRRTAESFDRI